MIRVLVTSCVLLFLATAASAASPPVTPAAIAVFDEDGAYVFRASDQSMPLYTFDRDVSGKSNCSGPCATAWPPVVAVENKTVGDWSVIKRDDGSSQWAWRGRPVYTFAQDQEGKAKGDGKGGVWHLLPTAPSH